MCGRNHTSCCVQIIQSKRYKYMWAIELGGGGGGGGGHFQMGVIGINIELGVIG